MNFANNLHVNVYCDCKTYFSKQMNWCGSIVVPGSGSARRTRRAALAALAAHFTLRKCNVKY